MVPADVVDQLPRRGDGYTLGRNDHEVVAIGEIHLPEQRIETFLLAKQYGGEIPRWTDDIDARAGKRWRDDVRLFQLVQVISDLDGPAADAPVGVRFYEMTARVVDYVPIDAVLIDVIGQEGLREISVLQLLILGHRHDLGARLIEDLPRQGG